jgi:hypothetical protein
MLWVRAARTAAFVAPLSVVACGLELDGLGVSPIDASALDVGADVSSQADDSAPEPDASPVDASMPPDSAPVDASPPVDVAVGPISITVPSSSGIGCPPFYDSGVSVAPGATLKITATGSWSYRTGFFCTAAGTTTPLGSINGAPYGELFAQFAGGAAFPVGTSYSAVVTQGGKLGFGINDDQCSGNYGSLNVTITVTP